MNLCLLIPVREIFQIYDEGTRAKAQFVCLCDYNPIFFRFSILKFGSKIKILSDLDMVLADNDEKWAKSTRKQVDFARENSINWILEAIGKFRYLTTDRIIDQS